MRVLFIGGTGNISTACTRLALEMGIDLFLLNRGMSVRTVSVPVHTIRADIRDVRHTASLLRNLEFDAVVDWVAYLPEHIECDIALFRGKTRQYVFISSASAYQKPPSCYLITESTPLSNPFWQYARDKIACEERLMQAYRDEGFPATIVRPSLTYGDDWIPAAVGGHDYTVLYRMKTGRKIIVHGDGQSLWVMTHNTDFAKGLIGLLGNPTAVGERYHITSDEVLTWDEIYRTIARAAGVEPDLVHIASEFIGLFDERLNGSLLGDKSYSVVFDNSKIRQTVPQFRASVSFSEGMRRCVEWFESDKSRKSVTPAADQLMDRIIGYYRRAYP